MEAPEKLKPWDFGPLIPPSETAIEVFEKVLEHDPSADMRAVPNQWVLNERGITGQVASELESKIEALEAATTMPGELVEEIKIALFEEFAEPEDELAAAQSALHKVLAWHEGKG